ncbi:glutathione S-transferase, putative [Talaromyces stipitatus ATCC 10500]|uniref:Glutathione S-transferase, putative n=1 Tax=Talaromyces stipitatus (strain ATCC 10500 / CBS 375.48 / QM 6759 / NRRL 1006) TaxID=441959 RepID=B8M1H4_TALSN|nr:glutathione S-transferase, putative [Talaromyces stipitatus ATCC 10500]EED21870.1 glutathione S-transferase, putative [Talaromyces stipitatus ATCC 10500]
MVSITVPENYGAVIAVALGGIPLLSWVQGNIVTSLRKPAKIRYPQYYATPAECKENPAAYKFNCAQRAHGNLLENMPQTILYMLIAGLKWPNATAALGTAWIVFRALYAHGYVTAAKPNGVGRFHGAPFWLVQGALWGMAVFGVGWELIKF